MKILITGASGFVAYHLVPYLLKKNCTIYAVDKNTSPSSAFRLRKLKELIDQQPTCGHINFIDHDLVQEGLENKIGTDIDYILHLAAESHVDRSIVDPFYYAQNNVLSTVQLLQFSRKLQGLKKFIYFSTDEVFGPGTAEHAFSEYGRYNSTNPYSASKAAAEEFCSAFASTYELPITVVHSMNIFGEGQSSEKFIPKVINHLSNGQTIKLHADKQKNPSRRTYIDAFDVCRLFDFLLITDLKPTDPLSKLVKVNLTHHQSLSCLELAELIAKHLGQKLNYQLVTHDDQRPNFDFEYVLRDNILGKAGYSTESNLVRRLPEIIDWYNKNPEWLDY